MPTQSISQVSSARASWELLRRGTPEAFVEALCRDAREHPAVHHAYLQRLAAGDLPDPQDAIRDFCHQYDYYSAGFTSYLQAVMGGLHDPRHRKLLSENLLEEQGQDPANPDNVPHTELFQRFRRAAGVTETGDSRVSPCPTALIWRDQFLQLCRSPQPGLGIGGIGIGTEMIVSTVYRYLHEAVTSHTDMAPEDYLFLTLHLDCDDEHAEQIKEISVDLAADLGHREALRLGVLSSLDLRSAFWDAMLSRAVSR